MSETKFHIHTEPQAIKTEAEKYEKGKAERKEGRNLKIRN
jgi:hypothetical protein